jgi:hypothetical protein
MAFPARILIALASLAGSLPIETSPTTLELGTTCGKNDYTTKQIQAAANRACQRLRAGTTVGSNKYPHELRNEEGFKFDVEPPVVEFPILTNGIYKGGKLCS